MSDNERDDTRAEPPGDEERQRQTRPGAEDEGTAGGEEEAAKAAAKAKAAAEAKAKAAAARAAAEAAKPLWEQLPSEPETSDASDDPLVEALKREFGEALTGATLRAGELAIELRGSAIREVAGGLKLDHGFTLLVDLCGVHYPQREEAPFEVVYHAFNIKENRRVRLRVPLGEGESVPSVTPVWVGANWLEREAWDMYGIPFDDHPDMTRILMWEGFNGHPLRKDFPVEGIDTGSAIYPEYYSEEAGPVAGTGTGWKPAAPPEPEEASGEESGD